MYKSSAYDQECWPDGSSQESYDQSTLNLNAPYPYFGPQYDQTYSDPVPYPPPQLDWKYRDPQSASEQYNYGPYMNYSQEANTSYNYQTESVDPSNAFGSAGKPESSECLNEQKSNEFEDLNNPEINTNESFQGNYNMGLSSQSFGFGGRSRGPRGFKRRSKLQSSQGSLQPNFKPIFFHKSQESLSTTTEKDESQSDNIVNGRAETVYTSPLMNVEDKCNNSATYASPLMPLELKRGFKQLPSKNVDSVPNNKRPLPIELDPNLPEEIVALMQNNSCDLCSVKLNSRIQAKTHYEGKPHAKRLKAAVEGKGAEKGADYTIVPPPPPKKKKTTITDESKLYCKCCDLSFTSTEHATQHYLGRNHQRVLHGLKPLKTGYFNKETGKWQRVPPDPRTTTEILDGTNPDPDSVKDKGKFFCSLCGVSATSQDQLDGHLQGQRHKKAEAMAAKNNQPVTSGSQDSILASIIKGGEDAKNKAKPCKDYSIYRTPSGKYYCAPCDLTLNSEMQFAQHIESKKHKLKKK